MKDRGTYEIFPDGSEKDISGEIPFDIPDSWEWIRHNEIIDISGGAQPPKSKFKSEPAAGYIRLFQIRDYGTTPNPVFIPEKSATKRTRKGDILLARYGASVGKVFFAEEGAYNVAMAKVIPLFPSIINITYLYYFYHGTIYQQLVKNNSRSAQAGFNREDMESLLFPLPPLNEQHRIVEKLGVLMKEFGATK
ncbi:MAG: restriction endonuclease subunit S [Akkermansia sp.]|nr:restriction endonuclease subunit S [Akkermansia sp.]